MQEQHQRQCTKRWPPGSSQARPCRGQALAGGRRGKGPQGGGAADRQQAAGGERVDHPLRAHGRGRAALVRKVLDLGVGQVAADDVRHLAAVVVLEAAPVLRHNLLELLRRASSCVTHISEQSPSVFRAPCAPA